MPKKKQEKGNLNSNLIGNLNTKNEDYYKPSEGIESQVNDPSNLGAWAILGQLKRIEEKIDQLRISGENEAKISPNLT